MPQNTKQIEAPGDAVRAAPSSTVRQLSAPQVRALLNALMHAPVNVVQQVGYLLMLFTAILEGNLPTGGGAPSSPALTAGRAATTAARGRTLVAKEGREQAEEIVARAQARRARGERRMGEGREGERATAKAIPKGKVKTLRSWAVQRSWGVPRFLRLLHATPEMGIEDALLVQHYIEGISPLEAGKALSAASAALDFVTRVSGDAVERARTKDTASNEVREESVVTNVLQEPHQQGVHAEHRLCRESAPADVAAGTNPTDGAIRIQAFVRGVIARRNTRAASAAATSTTLVQSRAKRKGDNHKASCVFAAAAAVRVQPAAAIVVQAIWRGAISRKIFFCQAIAAVTLQRWTRSTIVVRSLARTRKIAQARGARVLYSATVCAEYRFRTVCKVSRNMSAYSRAYRTAVVLLQRRWIRVVKNANLAARCHVVDEAEAFLRWLIRRRSQQAVLDAVVVPSPNADRCYSEFEVPNMSLISPDTTFLKVEDESWLVAAEKLSNEERSRSRAQIDGDNAGDSYCSNDVVCATGQRFTASGVKDARPALFIQKFRRRRPPKSSVDVTEPHKDNESDQAKYPASRLGLLEGSPVATGPSVQGARPSTDSCATDDYDIVAESTDSSASTSSSLASDTEAGRSSNSSEPCGTPRASTTEVNPPSPLVAARAAPSGCLSDNDSISTPVGGVLLTSDSTLTSRAARDDSKGCGYDDQRAEESRNTVDSIRKGNNRLDSSNALTGQQASLFPHKSNAILAMNAAPSATSGRNNVESVGGQLLTIQRAAITTSRRDIQGASCTQHHRSRTMRDASTEEDPAAAIRAVPPPRQPMSSAQLRVLFNALMHAPVDVVQQVGFLLMLLVAVVEASLPAGGAPSSAGSTAGRAAATSAREKAVVAKEEKEWATKIVSFAKMKQARRNYLKGEGGNATAKQALNVKVVKTLRRWAVRSKQAVPRLLRLFQETAVIGVGDALLLQYHAEGIEPREAGKALSAAAAALSYVTRVSGDVIARARTLAPDSNDSGEKNEGAVALQEPHHHAANAERPAREDILPAYVAAEGTRTAAVIRVQALTRGVLSRRVFLAAKTAAALVQAPNGSRFASEVDSANMGSTSPRATGLTVEDQSWLETAETLSEEENSRVWGRSGQETTEDSSSIDGNCVAGQPSSSLGADTDFGSSSTSSSSSSSINGSCCTSAAVATKGTPPPTPLAASTASPDSSLSDNDSTSSLLGGAMLESDSSTSAPRAKSADSNGRYSLEHRSEDRCGTGVRSGDSNSRPDSSPVDTPGAPFAQQPDIALPMDAAMALPFGRNRVKKVGDPSPTLQQAMVTLDEAVVWPVASSVKAEEEMVPGAEELPYGGGQIVGHDGEVICSQINYVPSFSLPRTPSPRRRRGGRSKGRSPPETPGSPDRPCTSTSPTTPPSLRRRRRREGGRRSSTRRLRSSSSSLSVIRVSSTACRSPEALFLTPPSSPDRLRTETEFTATSCRLVPVVDPVTKKAEGSSQAAGRAVVPVADSASKEDVSSQAEVMETHASGLVVTVFPAAANVGSASAAFRNTGRPKLKWGMYGTRHLRRRPARSATGGQAKLPVVQVRPTVSVQSKLRREQFVPEPESDNEDDDEIDGFPMVSTTGNSHGKGASGWSCWRRRVDESLETGIFPPARFRQFRTCPRYWCYQDYVLSEREVAMCARFPAVLVGGGAGVLIADVVEEHGRAAVEIALERSVRNAFNGGSRHTQRVPGSPQEPMAKGDTPAVSSGGATAAGGAGHPKTAKSERMPSADVGRRHAGACLDASVVHGDSGLAAQCGTSLQEQEGALEQCRIRARQCSAPLSVLPGMRGKGVLPADAGARCARSSSQTNTGVGEDSGLAAQCGTSLQEQKRALEQCRVRQRSAPLSVPGKRGEGILPADAGARCARSSSETKDEVGEESGLAAQCGTSLQEQERALEQLRVRQCNAPVSVPGKRGEGILPADGGARCARPSSETNAEVGEDSGLAALYSTSLREQEKALASCRSRQSGASGTASRSTKKSGKG